MTPQDPPGPVPATRSAPRVAGTAGDGWRTRPARRPLRLTVLGVLVAAVLAAAATAVVAGLWAERAAAPVALCGQSVPVRVVAAPALAPSLARAAEAAGGSPLSTGVCVDVDVVAEDPARTAASLAAGDAEVPDVWVPDSSLWLGRAVPAEGTGTRLRTLGSIASSPVVLATSAAAVTATGWVQAEPTWAEAMTGGRGLLVPDLPDDAAALQALVALQATAEDAEDARAALTAVTVALDRGGAEPAAEGPEALLAAGGAGEDASLVPTSEQRVFEANRGTGTTGVVAVQPRDAVTSLDHPLVRVDTPEREAGVSAAAVEGVVRLLEQQGREAALGDGFRPPQQEATASPEPSPAPSAPVAPLVVPPPSAEDVELLLAQLEEVGRPSRLLAVLDAGASLRAVTPTGETRAQVLQQAATGSLAQFPDTAAVGLWFFADGLGSGGADWVQVVPVGALDTDVDGRTQREVLEAAVATLPERLTPGETGLYATTLAAVQVLRDNHDPDASNSVVVVTDGRDDSSTGPTLQQLVERLREEADPDRPVRVIAIGLSPDVDADALTAIAEATGGAAYLAERPEDFEAVLADALRRR